MNDRLKTMLESSRRHNPNFGPESDFGLSRKKHYDVLEAAPWWKPTKSIKDAAAFYGQGTLANVIGEDR